jgi:hypothetical protein
VESKAVLPPPRALASVSSQPQGESVTVTAAAPLIQPPAPRAAQFSAGLVAGASQATLAGPDFIYTLSDDGKLRITPVVNGFLTVVANTDQVVVSNRPVQVSASMEFTLPPGANLATVFLTPQPSPPLAPPADVKVTKISVKPREEK